MSESRISRIVATEVIVPARKGYVDRPEFGDSIFDKGSKWIVEIETEDGLTGIGETERGVGGGSVRRAAEFILRKPLRSLPFQEPLEPDLTDHDMFGHLTPPVPHRLDEFRLLPNGAATAFRCAVTDLWGRALGVPIHALLGKICRNEIAVSWWCGRTDPTHAAERMEIALTQGFKSLKFKAAAEDDIAGIVAAVKSVGGPETLIIIDPNERFYRLTEALTIARRLEAYENIIFEDPFPYIAQEWNLFRQRSAIPLTIHARGQHPLIYSPERPFDFINLGGRDFLFAAELASHLHLRCWYGTGLELGILDAYILHHAAVSPACSLPGDVGHRIREDDLISETLEVRDGLIRVPDVPGLGVTIDSEALARYKMNSFTVA